MIKNMKKHKEIIFLYFFYMSYIFIKSILFYKFGISPKDYLLNFKGAGYYIIELLPIYLIGLFIILKNYNIYYNCRLKYRSNVIIEQYKKIILHTIVFVLVNFIVCILLFNNIYKFFSIHSVLYYILLLLLFTLGFILVSGIILLLNQITGFKNINLIILVYMIVAIENFIVFEIILSERIPIMISWVFVDKSLLLRILILVLMNSVLYTQVYNKSLNKDFV